MMSAGIICLIIFVIVMIWAFVVFDKEDRGPVIGVIVLAVLSLALSITFFCGYYATRGYPIETQNLAYKKIYQIKGVCPINDTCTVLVLDGGNGKLICATVSQTALEAGQFAQKVRSSADGKEIEFKRVTSGVSISKSRSQPAEKQ